MSTERRLATCLLCEAGCGIVVETDAGKVLSVRGDPDDPMSKGFICPKVIGMKELHEDPDRLRKPLIREDGRLREAEWEEALDAAATGIRRIREAYGNDALAVYQGNPAAHNLGLLTIGQAVLRSFATKNLYSASSADQVPQMRAAEEMFGNPVLMPVPDLDRTQHLLIVGANPLVSNGSIMTAPNMKARLAAIRARGGKVVVVDPRRTETAEVADEHVSIQPASDPWLLLSMLHVVFSEGLARRPKMGGKEQGWEALERLALDVPPERAAERTGIDAATIARLARAFAAAPSAAAYGRIGICHQPHGTLAVWLLYSLNAVTGNLDSPGGSMFTTPAVDVRKLVKVLGYIGHDRWRSRVRDLPEVAGEAPIATLADEIETPGKGQVRALLTCAGNPVLSAPNGRRLDAALGRLAFMVSVDGYLNETTRHADVILPPVSPLERSHYDIALNAYAVRNTAKFVDAPIARSEGTLHDWEILLELGLRIRLDGSAAGRIARRTAAAAGRAVGPEGMLDVLLRTGPHRLSVRALRKTPNGLDLGPLEPSLDRILETPNKRVRLAPEPFVAEARQMLSARPPTPREHHRFTLIGRRHLRSNNSWMHNSRALVKGPERCTLLMHPADASALSLKSGARIEVKSRVGSLVALLEVTDEMRSGVVSLPHGFGHGRPDTKLRVASEHAGVSVNDITDDQLIDNASGNAAFSSVSVEIRAVD
ncbi:MAG: molybdopterin-dependent oxidoreductase [Polyangiaceae bacterium]|nr:molybdopterin-dependent oxidoreductase [Polyangiaceae bacterium]